MKNQFILILALVALLASCNPHKGEAPTLCSGILPDSPNETIYLVPVEEYFPGLTITGSYPTTRTDSLGRFTLSFTPTRGNFYQVTNIFYHQLKRDLYIEPGDSLFVEQSAWNDPPRFLISGKGSEKLKHLEKDYSLFPQTRPFYDKITSNAFATEMDFKRFIDSIYSQRVAALASFPTLPERVRKYHLNTLMADRAQLLLEHLERRNYYMKQEYGYFYPQASYYQFLDSIDFDSDFSTTVAAKALSTDYLTFRTQQAIKANLKEAKDQGEMHIKFELVSALSPSLWTDCQAMSTIHGYSFGMMEDHFFTELKAFDSIMGPKFINSKNRELFAANMAPFKNLAPGNPAPDFALPDSKGVLHHLSDYKGTIVYLDFWGTWCYPCVQEIPDALALQEKYKDKPITFLYVAMEYDSTNIANWKQFILGKDQGIGKFMNNKPFTGVQLVAEKQFRNEAISAYQLNFAPTHVLIDPQGRIVSARALRSKDIEKKIDELLKKI